MKYGDPAIKKVPGRVECPYCEETFVAGAITALEAKNARLREALATTINLIEMGYAQRAAEHGRAMLNRREGDDERE